MPLRLSTKALALEPAKKARRDLELVGKGFCVGWEGLGASWEGPVAAPEGL